MISDAAAQATQRDLKIVASPFKQPGGRELLDPMLEVTLVVEPWVSRWGGHWHPVADSLFVDDAEPQREGVGKISPIRRLLRRCLGGGNRFARAVAVRCQPVPLGKCDPFDAPHDSTEFLPCLPSLQLSLELALERAEFGLDLLPRHSELLVNDSLTLCSRVAFRAGDMSLLVAFHRGDCVAVTAFTSIRRHGRARQGRFGAAARVLRETERAGGAR